MSSSLMRKACGVVGMLGGMAISSQVCGAIAEHAVDAGGSGPIQIKYGDHTINGALASGLDVDTYTFSAAAGDKIRITVSDLIPAPGLDAAIQLLDKNGTLLQSSFCAFGGGLCSTGFDRALLSTETYTINISDVNSDNAGEYLLNLDARSNSSEVKFKTL